jgi:hypothetical protein
MADPKIRSVFWLSCSRQDDMSIAAANLAPWPLPIRSHSLTPRLCPRWCDGVIPRICNTHSQVNIGIGGSKSPTRSVPTSHPRYVVPESPACLTESTSSTLIHKGGYCIQDLSWERQKCWSVRCRVWLKGLKMGLHRPTECVLWYGQEKQNYLDRRVDIDCSCASYQV